MDEIENTAPSSSTRSKGRIFGLWPKRSTKVEPQALGINDDINRQSNINNCIKKELTPSSSLSAAAVASTSKDLSFAKCSPVKRIKKLNESNHSNVTFRSPQFHRKNKNSISSTANNNRFSHQFNLCCTIDHKSQTPPVSVRYNSLPENVDKNHIDHKQKTDDNNKSDEINDVLSSVASNDTFAPLAEFETECFSAPESPVNKKTFYPHSSPSTNSVQSTKSDQPKSIAITACRSRLRLKLLPPGKNIVRNVNNDEENNGDLISKQHLSSPNILSNNLNENESTNNGQHIRSMSHDGIQSIQRTSVASTDSLAKQALMAAQMLSLIPTEKARERNYMSGRLATNPLLGINELIRVLPNKEVKIFVGTWNMNGQSPPKQMNDFVLPTGVEHVPDIVAIGTQESCSERFEWEVTLQETLGPTHILFHSTYLGTLHLAIFLRRDLVWFCSVPEDDSMSVRPGTAFRTKGAIAISFALFGTSLLFVTSHLTAHQQKVKERVQDVKRIIHALDLPKNLKLRHKNKDVTQNFDSVFWCGDLNFRLSEPREKLLEWIQNTKFPLPPHLPHDYIHTDQLSTVLADGAAFKGFMEAKIRFPPTYKYDPGTQFFDTSSKQRAPAYTDRILYKYRSSYLNLRRASHLYGHQSIPLECLAYDSVPSIISSDHKPVWALFRNVIRPGIDSVPLAAGLFNRDVYLEGMSRRLNNTETGSSAVCSIQ